MKQRHPISPADQFKLSELAKKVKTLKEAQGRRRGYDWPDHIRDEALNLSDIFGSYAVSCRTGIAYSAMSFWKRTRSVGPTSVEQIRITRIIPTQESSLPAYDMKNIVAILEKSGVKLSILCPQTVKEIAERIMR